ncbi:DUF1853 family protein [Undibacterium arcticum]|uniref:DUF1853 family protein n=1 Tax=Undibacterium arcticum TaxID=1762892 RepID=A0ABV7F2M0_9BURK
MQMPKPTPPAESTEPEQPFDPFQAHFHARWNHLNDRHVRALAWLLDAPDLLDPQAPSWQGRIATLAGAVDQAAIDWLAALDHAPAALHAMLERQNSQRLGLYAERLLAFYFQQQGSLIAHGLQVRADRTATVGEFDFLLRHGDALVHWEFATKFYLLAPSLGAETTVPNLDRLVGPNLGDRLGVKMRKMFDHQLMLAQHPAAQIHLPGPVQSAQALVKGWLFYAGVEQLPQSFGISPQHCRGFWRVLSELDAVVGDRFVVLPRLQWLAPAKATQDMVLSRQQLQSRLATHFGEHATPVLIAVMQESGNAMLEGSRGFIVPDDWPYRAQRAVPDGGRGEG